MRTCGICQIPGLLGIVLLWGPVCAADGFGGIQGWPPGSTASHNLIMSEQSPARWSYGITAADLTLGYDRPWQAGRLSLDPDLSAAYAIGGGINVALSPSTSLTSSLQFLWNKLDGGWRQAGHSRLPTSGLAGLNIRAVNLVIGVRAQF